MQLPKHSTPCIFFITGTSGAGKSTLVELLEQILPKSHFAVHDFDAFGVPSHAGTAWRQETTEHWLKIANTYAAAGKSTIICGVCVPSEILAAAIKPTAPIYFGLLDVPEKIIRQRLQDRCWNEELIADNITWAVHLKADTLKQEDPCVIACTESTNSHKVGELIKAWVFEKVSQPKIEPEVVASES